MAEENAVHAISQANHAFAFDVYKVLAEDPGNLFFSPVSIQVILALVFFGAKGNSARQLQIGLRLPEDKNTVEEGFSEIINQLHENNEVRLDIANKIYLKNGFGIKEEFSRAADRFKAGVEEVDFTQDATRQLINAWVEGKTNHKIKDIISPGVLDDLTRLLLVNAIYFKGDWLKKFNENDTATKPFHLASGTTKDVDLMYVKSKFQYAEISEFDSQIVYLPYKGRRTSLLVILPRQINGLENLEKNITTINIRNILARLNRRTVHVYLPKFKLEYKKELKDCLIRLGVADVFDSDANLTGISDESLIVSKVLHKSFIEVNEVGTEAAAATVVGFVYTSAYVGPVLEPVVFKADRPFLYLILDEQTQAVLFIGRYSSPPS